MLWMMLRMMLWPMMPRLIAVQSRRPGRQPVARIPLARTRSAEACRLLYAEHLLVRKPAASTAKLPCLTSARVSLCRENQTHSDTLPRRMDSQLKEMPPTRERGSRPVGQAANTRPTRAANTRPSPPSSTAPTAHQTTPRQAHAIPRLTSSERFRPWGLRRFPAKVAWLRS